LRRIPPSPYPLPCKAGKGDRDYEGILGGFAAQNTPFKGFPRPRLGAGARGWGHSVVQLRNSWNFGIVQFAGKVSLHFLRSLELPPRALTPPPLAFGGRRGEGEKKGFCGGLRPPQNPSS